MQFAYNVAMPALVFLTIAEERLERLLEWGFIAAFGGGSMLCFIVIYVATRMWWRRSAGASALIAAGAAMTNTGFVALPVLQALYGPRGVLAAAVATVLVAVLMFPPLIALLERDRDMVGGRRNICALIRMILVNPLIISTVLGLGWSLSGVASPHAAQRLPAYFWRRPDGLRAVLDRTWLLAIRPAARLAGFAGAQPGEACRGAGDCMVHCGRMRIEPRSIRLRP